MTFRRRKDIWQTRIGMENTTATNAAAAPGEGAAGTPMYSMTKIAGMSRAAAAYQDLSRTTGQRVAIHRATDSPKYTAVGTSEAVKSPRTPPTTPMLTDMASQPPLPTARMAQMRLAF